MTVVIASFPGIKASSILCSVDFLAHFVVVTDGASCKVWHAVGWCLSMVIPDTTGPIVENLALSLSFPI